LLTRRIQPINPDRASDSQDTGLTVRPGLVTYTCCVARQNPSWVDRTRACACAMDRELLGVPDL